MSTAAAPETPVSPADHGWVSWHRLVAGFGVDDTPAVAPHYRLCSLPGCADIPVAAIQRSSSGPRPAFWQPYCDEHARSRGVEATADGLDWTPEFLTGSVLPGAAHR